MLGEICFLSILVEAHTLGMHYFKIYRTSAKLLYEVVSKLIRLRCRLIHSLETQYEKCYPESQINFTNVITTSKFSRMMCLLKYLIKFQL